MIIYEVNLDVQPQTHDAFMQWLPGHIQEVLEIKGFKQAKILQPVGDNLSGSTRQVTVVYELETMADLNAYFQDHATAMRAKTVEKFGNKVKATRRIFKTLYPVDF